MSEPLLDLQNAVESLHGCPASFLESAQVKEEFQDQTVWEGTVHIFDLTDHPKAKLCYAWASPVEGSKKHKFYAVLHIPPVDSPEKAVRASIIQDHRSK